MPYGTPPLFRIICYQLIYSYVSLIQKRKQKRSRPPLLPRELKIDEVNSFALLCFYTTREDTRSSGGKEEY